MAQGRFAHPFGKDGTCVICRTKKDNLVNEICLPCSAPERKHKHIGSFGRTVLRAIYKR